MDYIANIQHNINVANEAIQEIEELNGYLTMTLQEAEAARRTLAPVVAAGDSSLSEVIGFLDWVRAKFASKYLVLSKDFASHHGGRLNLSLSGLLVTGPLDFEKVRAAVADGTRDQEVKDEILRMTRRRFNNLLGHARMEKLGGYFNRSRGKHYSKNFDRSEVMIFNWAAQNGITVNDSCLTRYYRRRLTSVADKAAMIRNTKKIATEIDSLIRTADVDLFSVSPTMLLNSVSRTINDMMTQQAKDARQLVSREDGSITKIKVANINNVWCNGCGVTTWTKISLVADDGRVIGDLSKYEDLRTQRARSIEEIFA